MNKKLLIGLLALVCGCSSQEVPAAHKGRMFDKTGFLALYSGGKGFEGPILNPGTYYTGIYPEVRMVDCSQSTIKEGMTALTKDGVQFGLDIYIRYSVNCDDNKVLETLFDRISPNPNFIEHKSPQPNQPSENTDKQNSLIISGAQVYAIYIRPAIGEAVREVVSPYIANEVNLKREEIFAKIKEKFSDILSKQEFHFVKVSDINLSNLDFPDAMDNANTDRAVQSILKDKSIAERERVTAEIETAKMRQQLVVNESANEAARIDAVGAALKRNPEYVAVEIFQKASEKGNMIILPANANQFIQLPTRK